MTDTDDTDELLLIPPDFFVVESDSGQPDSVQPYYNIVDKLIKQVDSLQGRLKSIEDSESFLSNSLDCTKSTNMDVPRQNFRKFNSTDDLQTSYSAQNTPQKPASKFKLNSLPNSPNVDRLQNSRSLRRGLGSRLVNDSFPDGKSTRFEKDGQSLNEIDTFLTKVKNIQRITAARNLEDDFNNYRVLKNEQKSQDSHYSGDEIIPMRKTWQCGDNKESVPDYGFGMRDTLYKQDILRDEVKHHTSNLENPRTNYNITNDSTPSLEKNFSDTSSDSTLVTAYAKSRSSKTNLLTNPIHSNALNILHMHKKLLEDSDHKKSSSDGYREHKRKSKNTVVGDFESELGLLNLADIWNGNGNCSLTESQLAQKLQEEKYRRKHCETLIQQLQTKNLEMQQKLSVAVKVDEAKNKTIHQFQDALEKLIARVEKLNKENVDHEFEINKLKNRHIDEQEEADQKISHYEKEASKALNLAHSNQEKANMLEKKCFQLESETQALKNKLDLIQENYAKECDKYKQISEILAQKDMEMNENKNTLTSASAEISQSKKTIENCQKEFNKMKDQYIKMDDKLKEERNQTLKLNKEIMDLLDDVESRKERETELQDDITKLKKQLDSNKVELRNFYQGQVEILVQNKLKEFQCQLDQTENNFKEEIKKREIGIAKSAASHIQQISEKYSLEIKLLEKKHQEEIKLYQIKVMQHKQQAESVQHKLVQFQEKRVTVAKQLQKVMESQWNEAMRIITSGKSPTFHDESAFSTIDQLNSLRTKSYNNLEEVLSQHNEDDLNSGRKNNEQEETGSMVAGNNDKISYDRFGHPMETPVSSRVVEMVKPAMSEAEIQKYLCLLLNKPMGNPSNPSQDDLAKELEYYCFDSNNRDREDGSRTSRGHHKDRRGPKPPWK